MASLEELEARLKRLDDIEAIRTLRMRYHYLLNERQFDRMHELYAPDALLDFGYVGRAEGTAAIRELFLRIPQKLQFVKQFIHNHMVEVDGDGATGVSYLDARYARDGESVIVAASFNENYRRLPEGWRIAETKLNLYFSVPLEQGWAGETLNHAPVL
jgi:ketosteroid isomerase-like protein